MNCTSKSEGVIPFHSELRSVTDDGVNGWMHEVKFGVVGVSAPCAVVIASQGFSEPVIHRRLCRGGLDLPDRLVDALAIACFRLLATYVVEQGGTCAAWTARDVRSWVRLHWPVAE